MSQLLAELARSPSDLREPKPSDEREQQENIKLLFQQAQ